MKNPWVKTKNEQSVLREGGRELARILAKLIHEVRPGVTTGSIGDMAEQLIRAIGGDPIFKGYGKAWGAPPFPGALCISINEEVVHGIPRKERVIVAGDIVKLDIGMRYRGLVTDMARTVLVGEASDEAKRLVTVVEASLLAGIATLHHGSTMEEYASAVERVVTQAGFQCVRDLVGHGVGHELHEEPQIPNYAQSNLQNFTFIEGMVVALEPMITAGTYHVELAPDAWAFVTRDKRLAAHWENTVLITRTGAEVLTLFENRTS